MRRFFSGTHGNAKLMINFFGLSFDMGLIRGGAYRGKGAESRIYGISEISKLYSLYIIFISRRNINLFPWCTLYVGRGDAKLT